MIDIKDRAVRAGLWLAASAILTISKERASVTGLIGHNRQDSRITVQVRLFNSLTRFAGGQDPQRELELEAGTTVGELAERLGIPLSEIFLVLVNGRDITRGLVGGPIKAYHMLDDRDVVAFSGAVPYSYGYGAPVV